METGVPIPHGGEHMTILHLPVEVVLSIIAWLPGCESTPERSQRQFNQHTLTRSFKALRLTSRALATTLEPLLLNAVNISSKSSAQEFLQWCQNYEASGHQLPVRRLTVTNVGPSSLKNNAQVVPYHVLEDIISVLAPSLHQLKIDFYDCFEFSEKLVHGFRRAKQLSVLHLRVLAQPLPSFDLDSPFLKTNSTTESPQLYDPSPFFSALAALPCLVELSLNNCFDYCSTLDSDYRLPNLPGVRHLIINVAAHSAPLSSNPETLLLHLCRGISGSLLILEINGSRYNSTKLLPVLASTQNCLEALHLSDVDLVYQCEELEFPRLRTLRLDDSRYLAAEEFNMPLFNHVSTLILRRWDGTDSPLEIPVGRFQNLRNIILTHTAHLTADTVPLFKACHAASVDLLSSTGPVDLTEIWAIDAM